MIVADRDYVKSKYDLPNLKVLEELVASEVEVNLPFNNPVTGFSSFTHKAGIHAKASKFFSNGKKWSSAEVLSACSSQ